MTFFTILRIFKRQIIWQKSHKTKIIQRIVDETIHWLSRYSSAQSLATYPIYQNYSKPRFLAKVFYTFIIDISHVPYIWDERIYKNVWNNDKVNLHIFLNPRFMLIIKDVNAWKRYCYWTLNSSSITQCCSIWSFRIFFFWFSESQL